MRSFLLLTLLISFRLFSQVEEARRITEALCSPDFHGRGYVQQGDSIAAEFIASEFQKLGLKSKGRSYFQKFDFPVNSFPTTMEVKIGDKRLTPGVHFLVDPSSCSGNTTLNPMPISVSTALNQKELLEAIKMVVAQKEFNSVALQFTNLTGDTLKKLSGLSREIAEIIPVVEITDKKFTWSVSSQQSKFPLIQIQDSVFKVDEDIKLNYEAKFIQQHHARNVIAYLPCRKKKAPTIVFTAHYDHLGQMGSSTYFPGANDNASGTAMLITMAKHFSEQKNKYNFVFIAFAGEEAGLIGSNYFVEHPTFPLKKIKFLINLDIMGSGEEGITVVNATEHQQEFDQLVAINKEMNLLPQVKSRGPAANSDHYYFAKKGVPAIFIYTMGPNKNYHDVFDTYQNLSFQAYASIQKLLITFITQLN